MLSLEAPVEDCRLHRDILGWFGVILKCLDIDAVASKFSGDGD